MITLGWLFVLIISCAFRENYGCLLPCVYFFLPFLFLLLLLLCLSREKKANSLHLQKKPANYRARAHKRVFFDTQNGFGSIGGITKILFSFDKLITQRSIPHG